MQFESIFGAVSKILQFTHKMFHLCHKSNAVQYQLFKFSQRIKYNLQNSRKRLRKLLQIIFNNTKSILIAIIISFSILNASIVYISVLYKSVVWAYLLFAYKDYNSYVESVLPLQHIGWCREC